MQYCKGAFGAIACGISASLVIAGPIEIKSSIFLAPELISSKSSECGELNISSARPPDGATVVMFILPSSNSISARDPRICRIEFRLLNPLPTQQSIEINVPEIAVRDSIVEIGYEIYPSRYKQIFKGDVRDSPKLNVLTQLRLPSGTNKIVLRMGKRDTPILKSEIQSITLRILSF